MSDSAPRAARPPDSLAGRDRLDAPTRALLALAAAIARGAEAELLGASEAARDAAVPPAWVDELLLQSVLMVGYPRALVGAAAWRAASGVPAPAEDPSAGEGLAVWEARGEATCAVVYGANYERLRANVRALHPALDRWMVVEGYGRVLSRPGLDLRRRELCSVAQLAVLAAPRQLHSHLRGALHAGATPAQVGEALDLVAPFLAPAEARLAAATWEGVRTAGEGGR